jgi:L-seryl-tRNA(Ser) seleniumtransferase
LGKELLKKVPSVDALLSRPESRHSIQEYGREEVLKATRSTLEELRSELLTEGKAPAAGAAVSEEDLVLRIEQRLAKKNTPSLRKAINATGILLHSGLGRAVLAEDARKALNKAAEGYSTLATDIETGRRGNRDSHYSPLLQELTGAESALVVNNNAAATVLILNTLAKGKDVILSRGQLVEIGGSFRMPEVMATSGALLREVGTTNKTHRRDYESAINENTGAIMRVHHSNYRIMGFAGEPEIEDLVEIGRKHNIPVIDDLGSGALVDLREFGLETEPLVERSIKAGVDAACFSGDKLIGGPQSGIIVGKAETIARIKKNPLSRAFRVGKLTIASLTETLRLFLNPEELKERHPVYRMLSVSMENLEKRALQAARKLKESVPGPAEFHVEESGSQVGSGSAPLGTIPTIVLAVTTPNIAPDALLKRLRGGEPPVFARIVKEAVLLDFRTILPDEDGLVVEAVRRILAAEGIRP